MKESKVECEGEIKGIPQILSCCHVLCTINNSEGNSHVAICSKYKRSCISLSPWQSHVIAWALPQLLFTLINYDIVPEARLQPILSPDPPCKKTSQEIYKTFGIFKTELASSDDMSTS